MNLKKTSTLILATRINEIEKEITNLEFEYNKIVNELCERMPQLRDDVNLQPKTRKRKLNDKR